ncbi:MAG: DUF192 domain-containing protein [Rhodanobacter sp.]|nr:MAG: DUF192 domain-containing protein [Rhodanobacter sp.]TAM13898.1 MAG: DUF192 domain-containing protein [Rhodanobacter sp.]TAM37740.1 MAG: DUF192 domain-containing protein [Rhodanobacter sp.]
MRKLLIGCLFGFLCDGCNHAAPPTVAVTLHGSQFAVELATDEAAREYGLMARSQLAAGHGMLFVFPDNAPRGFWMKNTLIALDILYFDADRKLVSAQRDAPPCQANPCPIYPSQGNAQYVLELPAGSARRIGAVHGDVLGIDGAIGAVR